MSKLESSLETSSCSCCTSFSASGVKSERTPAASVELNRVDSVVEAVVAVMVALVAVESAFDDFLQSPALDLLLL